MDLADFETIVFLSSFFSWISEYPQHLILSLLGQTKSGIHSLPFGSSLRIPLMALDTRLGLGVASSFSELAFDWPSGSLSSITKICTVL